MTSSSGSSLALGSHWDSPNAYPTICYCDKDVFSMDVYGSFRRIPTEILKKLVISIHSCTTAWVDGLEMAYRAYDIWYTNTWELHHLFWHRHVFSPNFPPAPALSGSFLVAGKCPNLYDQKPSLVAGPSETAKHAAEGHLHLGCRSFDRNWTVGPTWPSGKVLRIQTKVATEKAPPIIAQMEVKTYDQGLTWSKKKGQKQELDTNLTKQMPTKHLKSDVLPAKSFKSLHGYIDFHARVGSVFWPAPFASSRKD